MEQRSKSFRDALTSSSSHDLKVLLGRFQVAAQKTTQASGFYILVLRSKRRGIPEAMVAGSLYTIYYIPSILYHRFHTIFGSLCFCGLFGRFKFTWSPPEWPRQNPERLADPGGHSIDDKSCMAEVIYTETLGIRVGSAG